MKRLIASLTLIIASTAAFAAPYPEKPIKLLVPSSRGGRVDKLARAIGRKLERRAHFQSSKARSSGRWR